MKKGLRLFMLLSVAFLPFLKPCPDEEGIKTGQQKAGPATSGFETLP